MFKRASILFTNWIQSFDNNPNSGFSARKLSAFTSVMIALYVTIHYCSTEILVSVIHAWLVFALLCLGIITIEQIIKLKNGEQQQPPTQQPTGSQSDSV